jgi:hypothetical protein
MAILRGLSQEAFTQLIQALKAMPIVSDLEDESESVSASVTKIPSEDLVVVLDLVQTLYRVREFSETTDSSFLTDLVQAIRKSELPELGKMGKEEIKVLRENLERLLSLPNVRVVAKAKRLQRGGERLYCDATILSDIRPVFFEDVGAAPAGAVVGHTLKLAYHQGADHKEIFVVLDRSNLKSLREVIERAESKDKTLLDLLKSGGLKDLN